MDRRTFLNYSAGYVTAAAIVSLVPGAATGREKQAPHPRRDDWNTFTDPLWQVIAIALNAPSPHNIQPWKFRIVTKRQVLLFIDPARCLPHADPENRQLHLSAGCLLEAMKIGATGIGYKANVILFPRQQDSYAIGSDVPLASVLLEPDAGAKHPLWDAIFERSTNRLVYSGPVVTAEEIAQLKAAFPVQNTRLRFINDGEEMKTCADLLLKAVDTESHTRAVNEEIRAHFRFSGTEAAAHRDGLTFEANGFTGFSKFLASTFTSNTAESWNKPATIQKSLAHFEKGLRSARGFIAWISPANTVEQQVLAGADFYRCSLALTKAGLCLHPISQALEEYPEMADVRAGMNTFIGVKGTEKIQMIARIGRAAKPYQSYRRLVQDVT